MKTYRPLLLRELDVRLPGLHVRRLQLNRHLPKSETVSTHSHPFTQILCYLAGSGTMISSACLTEIHPGSIAIIPPRCEHAFDKTSAQSPLCLVLDLDWQGAHRTEAEFTRLGHSDKAAIRQELSSLTRLRDPNEASCRLLVAASALRILDILFRSIQYLPPRQTRTPAFVREYDKLLAQNADSPPSATEVAAKLGYQVDYFNRIFKQATGQTLREYRETHQLSKAKRLLMERRPVNEVCTAIGIFDQSYFSRWFKKHTGVQPKHFWESSLVRPSQAAVGVS
jgi:AraC family transcriptional regulator, transcriptional activator of pobA